MDKWQPMDTAPKDGRPILVCFDDYSDRLDLGGHPMSVRWQEYHPNAKGKKAWRNHHGHIVSPCAWMPMPEAPKVTRSKP